MSTLVRTTTLVDTPPVPRRLAVSLHGVAPATFSRCALIRDWLDDFGVDRVTLLAIPAPDLHPFSDRSPALAQWLLEREAAGDTIAQHGFTHGAMGGTDEFFGLDEHEARRSVDAGRRIFKLAGIEARGFVAPGYAYTSPLRRVLAERFDWWASSQGVRFDGGTRRTRSPALGLAGAPASSARTLGSLRLGALTAGSLLRLELHPSDFDRTGHVHALEWVLRHAAEREVVTYDELAAVPA